MHDVSVMENNAMRALRCSLERDGPVHWSSQESLMIADAQTAQRFDAENFSDLMMLDGFSEVVLGKKSQAISWAQLRSVWATQMRQLTNSGGIRELTLRMNNILKAESGRQQDLAWLGERIAIESLIPCIISGLAPAAHRRIVSEVLSKVTWVLSDVEQDFNLRWHRMKMLYFQILAGLEVRRELKRRAGGQKPRQQDLADAVIELLPQLGIDRAVDAVTALLTAITGSPGAAAACLLYELDRQHYWRERLETEFSNVSFEKLYESPMRAAPLAGRFVKEILRIWSSPPIVSRRARTDISHGAVTLKVGQHYYLSSYMIHRNTTDWSNPEIFDPDRWLADGQHEACRHSSYVPFGWAPKSCIGANLGMSQLIVLVYLLCTRYRLQVSNPERAKIAVASVVRPIEFHGSVQLR